MTHFVLGVLSQEQASWSRVEGKVVYAANMTCGQGKASTV
jgi:hypothetical protein